MTALLNSLSPRSRYHHLIFVAWPIGASAIGLLAFGVSHWLVLLLFPYLLWINITCMQIRCPSCGKQVGWSEYRAFGARLFDWWKTIIPRNCERCSYDLEQRPSSTNPTA